MGMKLESLANELFLDIFEYMSTVQVFSSFRSLNSRFDQLIFTYFQITRDVDLRLMSLNDSKFFCQSYLSQIVSQIISLTISTNDDTPFQMDFFPCNGFRFRQFVNLQSLSLHHVHSYKNLAEIKLELDYLPHLTHIKLVDCQLRSGRFHSIDMIDKIWSMPKMIRCDMTLYPWRGSTNFVPSVISLSLLYVSIYSVTNDNYSFPRLFECTPNLRSLYTNLDSISRNTDMQLSGSLVKFEFNKKQQFSYFEIMGWESIERYYCTFLWMEMIGKMC
jgi:hypothetical protein